MEHIDEELIRKIDAFIESIFVRPDDGLTAALRETEAAGLPAIHISPNQGKLLYLIVRIARARRVLEIGTLGGYSSLWLAHGVMPGGSVVSLEVNSRHAEVASRNIERAGFSAIVQVRQGKAVDTLEQMIAAGEPSFDLIFIDADKPSYATYLHSALELSHAGTVILADNLVRNGAVLNFDDNDENVRGVRAYNEAIASDPRLESIIVPIFRDKVDGLGITIVRQDRTGSDQRLGSDERSSITEIKSS